MNINLRNLSVVFTGGAIGGFFTALAVYIFVTTGIVASLGSAIQLEYHPIWFIDPPFNYRLMVWGGFFGILFLLPFARKMVWWHWGLIVGGIAGSASLFVMFPIKYGMDMFAGMPLGPGTVPWIIFFNLFYGIPTAYFVKRVGLE